MSEPIRCTWCGKTLGMSEHPDQPTEATCNSCKEESDSRYSPYPQMV